MLVEAILAFAGQILWAMPPITIGVGVNVGILSYARLVGATVDGNLGLKGGLLYVACLAVYRYC